MYSPLVRYLDTRLFVRKLVHILGGLLAAALVFWLPRPASLLLAGAVIVVYWLISRRVSLALITAVGLLALTASRPIVAGALIVLALGDGAAGLAGRSLGRTPWQWRNDKTIEGSLAFWSAATIGMFAFGSAMLPHTPAADRLLLAALPALGGCLAEMLPLEITQNGKPDDNLGIVLASGALLYLLCLGLRVGAAFAI